MLAAISTGDGDGTVDVEVDGYGAFGRAVSGSSDDAYFDQIGAAGIIGTIYESGVAIGNGSDRVFLTDGSIGGSGNQPTVSVAVSNGGKTASSSFTLSGLTGSNAALNGLTVDLTQEISVVFDADGTTQIGSLLTQTYVISNPTVAAIPFELVRYNDVDVVDTGSDDGGGRIEIGGNDVLFTTSSTTDIADSDVFVAITASGGTIPLTNRFEVEEYSALRDNTVISGVALDDDVFNDSNDDDLIDEGYLDDSTLALRNEFSLSPSQSVVYVTETLWAEGVVVDVLNDGFSAPVVTAVTISGPNPLDGNHDPTDGSYDIPAGDGSQIGTVPVGGANTVTVTFSEAVVLAGNELTLQSARDGSFYTLDYIDDGNAMTGVWELAVGSFGADQVILNLDGDTSDSNGIAVTDTAGNLLDGEWTNPLSITDTGTSVFPSGDGTAGGDFEFYFTILTGDFSRDNIVGNADSAILSAHWQMSGAFVDGDANGDGTVEGADMSIMGGVWQEDFTVWPTAPQVTAVTISGPNSLDGNHGPTDGSYDIPVGDGSQIGTVPVGGAYEITITFSEGVDVDQDDLSLLSATGTVTYDVLNDSTFAHTAGSNVATWTFSSAFVADQIVLALDESIVDTSGVHLDGEWTNPLSITDTGTSVFPSGDGIAGGDFEFYFTILPGDFNGDNIVENADFAILSAHWQMSGSFVDGDANGDGTVEGADMSIMGGVWQEDFTVWPGAQLRAASGGGSGSSSLLTARDQALTKFGLSLSEDVEDEGAFWRLGSRFAV